MRRRHDCHCDEVGLNNGLFLANHLGAVGRPRPQVRLRPPSSIMTSFTRKATYVIEVFSEWAT